MMQEPIWIARKEGLIKMIEFYLLESLREGMSLHLANVTPCNFIELNKLLALFRHALGK